MRGRGEGEGGRRGRRRRMKRRGGEEEGRRGGAERRRGGGGGGTHTQEPKQKRTRQPNTMKVANKLKTKIAIGLC